MDRVGEGWDPPQEVRDHVQFHWFHVTPGTSLVLVMLSLKPLWFVGHFVGGRMCRCTGDLCARCAAGTGRQIRYVVSAVELTSRRIGVLEMSESVAHLIREWAVAQSGARGLIVEFGKVSKSKHSRLEVNLIREHAPGWALAMEPLDLHEVLARTWERIDNEKGSALVGSGS